MKHCSFHASFRRGCGDCEDRRDGYLPRNTPWDLTPRPPTPSPPQKKAGTPVQAFDPAVHGCWECFRPAPGMNYGRSGCRICGRFADPGVDVSYKSFR